MPLGLASRQQLESQSQWVSGEATWSKLRRTPKPLLQCQDRAAQGCILAILSDLYCQTCRQYQLSSKTRGENIQEMKNDVRLTLAFSNFVHLNLFRTRVHLFVRLQSQATLISTCLRPSKDV